MEFEFERKKLYAHLGKNLLADLKGHQCYVAGGTITSLFCNREINDIDVYFKSESAFVDFVSSVWEDRSGWIISVTDKATLIKLDGRDEIQMIHFKFFPTATDIFDTFDFTVCMGAFDFESEEFVLHPDFMQHNSQRILKFNKKTSFPIVSLLRIQKYKEKGYNISKPEFIRIALTCMNLDINTYEELKEQMGGMYGVNYDKLFKDKEGEVDLEEAIDVIANLSLEDDYFKEACEHGEQMGNLEEYLDDVTKSGIPYVEINDEIFRVYNSRLCSADNEPKKGILVDINDVLKDLKVYKFVKKDNGKYLSFFDGSFEYKLGEKVTAKGRGNYIYYNQEPSLYFNYTDSVDRSHYIHSENRVLIESEFDPNDFIDGDKDAIQVKSATMIREVPEEEWKGW
jgi:flagellin-specific chaperone FliS